MAEPEPTPGLPEYDVARMKEWVTKFLPKGCPVCGANRMGTAEKVVIPAASPGIPTTLSKSMPFVPLSCGRCGYTIFLEYTALQIEDWKRPG